MKIATAIPPPGLVLLAIFAIQVGAALATQLFPFLGASGTVAVRIVFSALLLIVASGGKVGSLWRTLAANPALLLTFGLSIAAMNLCFYQAIARIPLAIPITGVLVSSPLILLAGLGVGLLSTTIPCTLEFNALKRMSPQSYGVLVSLEPGVAAIVGAAVLREHLEPQGVLANGCVVVASIGITISDKRLAP